MTLTEAEGAKLLLQKFLQSDTDFVLLIVRWSYREHLFGRKENKVSGILRERLKQMLSTFHASSAARICHYHCQLLCTAPVETFQIQVLTNNMGHRRPMNTRLPWYLTDSSVDLRLFLLTRGLTINCLNVFIERELTFTFAICYRPSVCLSVTFVRPTQAVQIFGNISTALGTLATQWHPLKI